MSDNSNHHHFKVTQKDKTLALAHYAQVAANYEDHVTGNPLLRFFRRRERASIEKFLDFEDNCQSLIDVGCGSGTWAKLAKRRGLKVKAVDANEEMIRALEPILDSVEVIDLDSWSPTEQFDLVICAGVLDFVLSPEKAMKTLCQLVAPGGRLIILVPDAGPFGIYYRCEKALIGVKVNLFSKDWLSRQARLHGLLLKERSRPLPSNVTYLFKRP